MTGSEGALLGGIEAGGTRFRCAVATAPDRILREGVVPTTNPAETLGAVREFFESAAAGPLAALGIASFGPVGVTPGRPDWGRLLATPKPGWSGTDLAGYFATALGCKVALDTDVNGAVLAESRYGAGQGAGTLVYVTIGTGIGGGILVEGKPLHGRLHPEIGHLRPRRGAGDTGFPGSCPFHGDCFEGLASGSAIARRFGAELGTLPADHPAWALEADYLAQLSAALVFAVSPDRIIFGGGVMEQTRLFPMIRARLGHWLAGYPEPIAEAGPTDLIRPSGLGGRAGLIGSLLLARDLLSSASAGSGS
jgi:fructokinase